MTSRPPGADLRIVVYSAAPGSEAAQRLELLRVAGLQAFCPAPDEATKDATTTGAAHAAP